MPRPDGESRSREGPAPLGCGSPTSARDHLPAKGTVAVIVQAGHDDRLPLRWGQPSNFSLNSRELAAEIRRCRRDGWASWEIRQRFSFGRAA